MENAARPGSGAAATDTEAWFGAAIAAVRADGAWITRGPAFADADTVAPLSASVPLALAANESDPEPVVWYAHWKLRVACAGTSSAPGELLRVAEPFPVTTGTAGVTESASACPELVMSSRRETSWPTLTCIRSIVAVACRYAAVAIVMALDVADGDATAAPVF